MVQDDMSVRPLSAALRKKAEEELNETPEKIVSHLKILQDWVKTQPDLKTMKTTNQWLIAFLRGCKYDVEKVKGKLKMYATYKTTIPEFYGNRDPFDPDIQEILKLGALLPLHKTTSDDAPRFCLYRLGYYSLTKRPLVDLMKVSLMIFEILLLEDDNFVVAGTDSLCDLKGMGFGFILQFTPFLAKKALTCAEKTLSVRLTRIQILHPPYGFSYALAILKLFLTAKAKSRIHLHNEIESVYEQTDKSIFPEEYGGTNSKLQDLTDYWKDKIESYRDWFVDENNEDPK